MTCNAAPHSAGFSDDENTLDMRLFPTMLPGATEQAKEHGTALTKHPRPVLEQWELDCKDIRTGKELNRTLKSTLHRATWNGKDIVVKSSIDDDAELLHELTIHASVKHPDLVMLLGCCIQHSSVMIVTEYMPGGDLEKYYGDQRKKRGGRWVPEQRWIERWACGVLRALRYLHSGGETPIIHRDLKPMNILLTADLHAKVADFGISKMVSQHTGCFRATKPPRSDPPSPRSSSKTLTSSVSDGVSTTCSLHSAWGGMTRGVGSYRYMAPEVARGQAYNEKIDIYSWGLVLYFMSVGMRPFHEYADIERVLEAYSAGQEPRPKTTACPPKFRPIMEVAWHTDPDERPSASDLVIAMEGIGDNATCSCNLM